MEIRRLVALAITIAAARSVRAEDCDARRSQLAELRTAAASQSTAAAYAQLVDALKSFAAAHCYRQTDGNLWQEMLSAEAMFLDRRDRELKKSKAAEEAAAEQQRYIQLAQELRAWNDEVDQWRNDPATAPTIAGARICAALSRKREALHEIADERRVARQTGGGVIDLHNIYEWQQAAAEADRALSVARAKTRAAGIRPRKCDDTNTSIIAACMNLTPVHTGSNPWNRSYGDESCDDRSALQLLQIADE